MPRSKNIFTYELSSFLTECFKRNNITHILDVGPGIGKYADILPEFKLDCVEVYEPYVEKYKLRDKYNKVVIQNIIDFDFSEYQFIILGDVLEHLSAVDAISIIDKINSLHQKCLVVVPYMYEQGEYRGNIYEAHLQPDLTPKIMKKRYPTLKLLIGNDNKGCYINFDETLKTYKIQQHENN